MRRYIGWIVGFMVVSTVIVPSSLVVLLGKKHGAPVPAAAPEQLQTFTGDAQIKVYMTKTGQVVTMPLETYVAGVVAGEMPITFELQALEAQAIAARTRAVNTLINHIAPKLPAAAQAGANITDSYRYDQAYSSDELLRQKWGSDYEANQKKIEQAVNATHGEILTYQGKPIDALYFSTSNGYTEDAKDYWGHDVPYLKSVPSPWDSVAPRFHQETAIPVSTVLEKLHIDSIPASTGNSLPMKVLAESPSKHVLEMQVGDKRFTGRQIREALGLNSTSFTWKVQNREVYFDTSGYGHDTGMSQYGANGMAKEGKTATQILTYYYQGVQITNAYSYLVAANVPVKQQTR
ncbi:stage II sporulation protein D [Fodinisporobacter ferrooxydans]|uniref:Stage II sporulation protein D n=1 Tax=Fodinisporobacter ferrooxydans TaxID=2901836 RepID=A0ABY4CMH3_9BACL|nr:stage II sporulation protein D [Alicyclobacillaceae bacterium MYW30-H2]